MSYSLGWGLVGPGFSAAGQVPTAADSLKGRIWTATAQRIWAVAKPKQPQPQPWATGTDFNEWISTQKKDRSELGLLRGAVIDRIGKGQTGTPGQVAEAILAEVAARKKATKGALARLDTGAIRKDLAPFLPTTTAPIRPTSKSSVAQPLTVAEDPRPTPDTPAEPTPTVVYQTRSGYLFRPVAGRGGHFAGAAERGGWGRGCMPYCDLPGAPVIITGTGKRHYFLNQILPSICLSKTARKKARFSGLKGVFITLS